MFGRELSPPDQLQDYSPSDNVEFPHQYVASTKIRLDQAHEELRQRQMKIKLEELRLFVIGDMI